ncbi:DNA-binding transcriptional MerR regulator [Nocardia transvalensis]|uniref:DNA-binding transcriptional MerR regulator n=1 Tax=Nocardia transvalensis TaxID=37333 RepID=A0A7W9ULB5_9NOCA|nr:MerR family transcriptional regulator [Nocardia transvalensis]MBB5917374.1 DNA-binding transcriptional MerR regulator [Nocardia transvalensis]
MGSLNSAALRTADVARRAGYSVQQVRDLEHEAVLPPAARTPSGYRVYDESHVHSALAYRRLAAGVGPAAAREIMRAVHTRPLPEVLALLDAAHARLDRERRDLGFAKTAARAIAAEPLADARPSDEMSISELADALGVRTSTLRYWDSVRLVVPSRVDTRAARVYTPGDVRDARIVHQLRSAGYGIPALQALVPQLRAAGGVDAVMAGLAARDASIDTRSRALFEAAAALAPLLTPPR